MSHKRPFTNHTSLNSAACDAGDIVPSVLSARTYVNESQQVQAVEADHGHELMPLPSSLVFGLHLEQDGNAGTVPSDLPFHTFPNAVDQPESRASAKTTPGLNNATGAGESSPRKIGTSERRRRQVRDAQRSYRQRKASEQSATASRVAQLEQGVEELSTILITLHDQISQSGLMLMNARIANHTQHALARSLEVARRLDPVQQADDLQSLTSQAEPSRVRSGDFAYNEASPEFTGQMSLTLSLVHHLLEKTFNFPGHVIPISTFMKHLHRAVLYHAYAILADQSVSLKVVRERFGLLYPTFNRIQLTDFVASLIQSSISGLNLPDAWESMPLYQLGGAGTHYPLPTKAGTYIRRPTPRRVEVVVRPGAKEGLAGLGGAWFDPQDLECFLEEKKVAFVSPNIRLDPSHEEKQLLTNPRKFLSGLLEESVCLGLSAGFRRAHVEVSLDKASIMETEATLDKVSII